VDRARVLGSRGRPGGRGESVVRGRRRGARSDQHAGSEPGVEEEEHEARLGGRCGQQGERGQRRVVGRIEKRKFDAWDWRIDEADDEREYKERWNVRRETGDGDSSQYGREDGDFDERDVGFTSQFISSSPPVISFLPN
jgi:hypothetical protein